MGVMGAGGNGVAHVVRVRSPPEVRRGVVRLIAVHVACFPRRLWNAVERGAHEPVDPDHSPSPVDVYPDVEIPVRVH